MIQLQFELQQWLQEYLRHPSPLEFDDLCESTLSAGFQFGEGKYSRDVLYQIEKTFLQDRRMPAEKRLFTHGSPSSKWLEGRQDHIRRNLMRYNFEYLLEIKDHLNKEVFSAPANQRLLNAKVELDINSSSVIPNLNINGQDYCWPSMPARKLDREHLEALLIQASGYCAILATKKTELEFTRSLKTLMDRGAVSPTSSPEPL